MEIKRIDLKHLCIFLRQNHVKKMVEVGSFAGDSTIVFAHFIPEVISVDPYIDGYDERDLSSNKENLKIAKKIFNLRIQKKENISHINETSEDASVLFDKRSLDFVYIDACHKYDCVKNDIKFWIPKIKPGMFIGGHDFRNPRHPGVTEAILEVLGEPRITFRDTSWIFRISPTYKGDF